MVKAEVGLPAEILKEVKSEKVGSESGSDGRLQSIHWKIPGYSLSRLVSLETGVDWEGRNRTQQRRKPKLNGPKKGVSK